MNVQPQEKRRAENVASRSLADQMFYTVVAMCPADQNAFLVRYNAWACSCASADELCWKGKSDE